MQNTEHTLTQNPVNSIDKWTDAEYRYPFHQWTPPRLVYPVSQTERDTLHALKDTFAPMRIYPDMESRSAEVNSQVQIDVPIPAGYIAFLENTAEQCISPQTKHSQEGMKGARHWVQRVDTPDRIFQRLTDGYGVSLMCGERHYQYIRNRNNWRATSGMMLDIDVFRDDEHPDAPPPVYSQSELFDRCPLLQSICTYLIPSASSLYDGRPYKARGVILFPKAITDQRIYRAFGDILLSEIDCIPANVTKNPVAVGFGNTHNASQAYRNGQVDNAWIAEALDTAETTALTVATQRTKEQKHKAELREHYNTNGARRGENISEFINTCDAVGEMVREGLLTRGRGNEYKWHGSQSDRSCEIFDDGVIHIFSATMQTFSPAPETEPVNGHRFYLYQLSGLDLAKESEQAKCREYLFDRGYGSDPKAYTKAKLKRTPPAEIPEPVNAPAETLAENRDSREQATDAFFTSEPDTPERLKVLLIRDDTGTGKSHTILTKAGQYGKRTLAQYTHTELATQAVETVWEFGYKNPCHLKGRAHNWDEAGIAEIPVNMRTADLFEKNNCIMFDCVQEYTDNRLAPRTYCEHKCPFKDDCLHLAQYQGLGDRDFIATCAPDVLFDLKFRGYLNSLVTATSEPTDDELAIDAAWGTESEATENFDFAIVDDYGISALYPDVVFTEKEFKALKTAWKGKPTADFAKQVLKAFEKKKPHKIVKALRNALESTSEHHTEIAEALTQHARIGVIEAYEKRAIETAHLPADHQGVYAKARVRYDDGGMQFIPNVEYTPTHTQVMKLAKQLPSAETKPFTEAMYIGKRTYTDTRLENIRKHYAYKVLKSKEIPVINPNRLDTDNVGDRVCIPHAPVHALIAGVSVSDLTPVWQSGATPIELLQIFLTSLGADKNAPIHRTFRVSTEQPNAVLTFSIPPQAPVGILPQIAMLSATTDTEAVKEAFTGQAVDFSEHIGGQVELADGVQIYQFADARLTSASVFEYPKDTKGKRKLQETPTALTPTAENRLVKLNNWAKAIDGVTAFISYKEFTDDPFNDAVNGFDIVTHFDRVAGLNFDGLKFLVVFGYPKVNHDVVMNQARVQYARDTQPLPKGTYDDLTQDTPFTERGYTITERRYKDPRLEKIRHQLATEKLNQAIGRARLPRWTDTETLIFTDAPIERITERATLFSSHAFNLAETPDGLSDAMHRIEKAEATGDVKTVMETKGVSERTARHQTKATRDKKKSDRDDAIIALHKEGKSQREIKDLTGVSLGTVNSIITGVQKRQSPISNSNWTLPKMNTTTNTGETCVESQPPPEPVKSNGNAPNPSKERARPEWHTVAYYSEGAIRKRLKKAKIAKKECDKATGTHPPEPPNLHTNGNGGNGVDTNEQRTRRN